MSYSRCLSCCLAGLLVASCFAAASETPRMTAVFDQENLPYSSQHGLPEGLDVEVARLIALQMGIQLDVQWIDTENEGLLSLLIESDSTADLSVGVPVELRTVEDERRVGDRVAFSRPYASTRYVLVTRKTSPDLPDFKAVGLEHIGAETGSVASGVLWDLGFIVRGRPSQRELLEAVARGELGYAALWSNAGWLISRDDDLRRILRVQLADPGTPRLSWNLAVAVAKEDTHLLSRIDEAIDSLRTLDAFRSLFIKYKIPYFDPVDSEEPTQP